MTNSQRMQERAVMIFLDHLPVTIAALFAP